MDLLELSMYIAGGLLGLAVICAIIAQIVLFIKYSKVNKIKTEGNVASQDAARRMLDENGLEDVQVKRSGWFMAQIFGNRYSMRKKTIYIRRNIWDKTTVTAVGVAVQKVGLAIQHKNGNKKFLIRAKLEPYTMLAPALFIPVIIIGVLIDVFMGLGGVSAMIGVALGMLYLLAGLIVTMMTIPVEKAGCIEAMRMLESSTLLNEEEMLMMNKVYKSYMITYILNFVVMILDILYMILKIANSAKK